MTYVLINTAGETRGFTEVLTASGIGIKDVENGTTSGDINKEYLAIKTSASDINLSEVEAYDLIDLIRSELEINNDE